MKKHFKPDEWLIIEEGFHPERNEIAESCFSIGNGRMGQRANFEEQYSGDSLQGSYVAGIYYPDKTKVGWWKSGYPDYYAKILNSPNWIGINVYLDGEAIDLNTCKVRDFRRVLNMREGWLERSFTVKTLSGKEAKVLARRFCSMVEPEVGAIRYSVTALNFSGIITITPYLDGDVRNRDANWEDKFWVNVQKSVKRRSAYLTVETQKTQFQVCAGMKFSLFKKATREKVPEKELEFESIRVVEENYVSCAVEVKVKEKEEVLVYKYAGVISSFYYDKKLLNQQCEKVVKQAFKKGFDQLLKEHAAAWVAKWEEADIVVEGDLAVQQAIRFNIFQLCQTYTGADDRLNIGTNGFTGEKYGGSTYWDTEAYCLPFFLATAEQKVARNLLIYRYKHLQKAIENATKLGFKNGAALYPMVTINGEECHNEWEITFEEIHRNGAIAYAIFDYIRYTGDSVYLTEFGLEVLIGIARFWAQRVNWSEQKQQWVMLGVTGPNEYENNVNNNWYTNFLAVWCLKYALEALDFVATNAPEKGKALLHRIQFKEPEETTNWKDIIQKMYLPEDLSQGIFIQQEGYLDKEMRTVADLSPEDLPLNQKWSWDRILRSCFIKQADVLQGIYFFEDQFDVETIRRNFEFYEPRTVHENSSSASVHAILAAKLGMYEKAYEMHLRSVRLDLDNINHDTLEGLHITSMASAWMSFIEGFGGMRSHSECLEFSPFLPKGWKRFSFKIRWRERILSVNVDAEGVTVRNLSELPLPVLVYGKKWELDGNSEVKI